MTAVLAACATGAFVYLLAAAVARGRAGRPGPVRSRRPVVADRRPARSSIGWRLGVAAGALVVGAVLVAATGLWPLGLGGAAVVAWSPRWQVQRIRAREAEAIRRAWPDALRDVAGAVAGGRSLAGALEDLATSGPMAMRSAFADHGALARALGVETALAILRERLADPTSDRILEILGYAVRQGGRLVVEVVADLADATVEDLAAAEESRTAVLEHAINAWVVFLLPWIVLLALTVGDGAFRSFYRMPLGTVVLVLGAAMSISGAVWARRLGAEPVEPRVLTGRAEVSR